ncbi:MAG: colanic acid biosynthesis acetyltransferase WcaF [Richelia sp. CSU_2_1]|nr:colanic acid biosynthesis acetyltransferase WcaF [Richelia sp. CSU_2_1]
MFSNSPTSDPEPDNATASAAHSAIDYTAISGGRSGAIAGECAGESWVDLRQYNQSNFDRGKPGWFVLLWWLLQAIVFPLTPHPFNHIRRWLLRLFGAQIGRGVIVRPTARFTYPWKVEIGDWSWIGDDVVFYSLDRISIGKHCVISQKSYLCTGTHDSRDPAFRLITASVIIHDGAWIAADCFISPGVEIGANTLIGARSSVFKNMPAGFVCMGNPCVPRYRREIRNS